MLLISSSQILTYQTESNFLLSMVLISRYFSFCRSRHLSHPSTPVLLAIFDPDPQTDFLTYDMRLPWLVSKTPTQQTPTQQFSGVSYSGIKTQGLSISTGCTHAAEWLLHGHRLWSLSTGCTAHVSVSET